MSKKAINQNTNYDSELLNSIDSNFVFNENPINRLRNTADNVKKDNTSPSSDESTSNEDSSSDDSSEGDTDSEEESTEE